eukprot:6208483-Pleurochrysis_carterae.AAC.1
MCCKPRACFRDTCLEHVQEPRSIATDSLLCEETEVAPVARRSDIHSCRGKALKNMIGTKPGCYLLGVPGAPHFRGVPGAPSDPLKLRDTYARMDSGACFQASTHTLATTLAPLHSLTH